MEIVRYKPCMMIMVNKQQVDFKLNYPTGHKIDRRDGPCEPSDPLR